MATPPTVTGIEPEEVRGDVNRLLPPLERALRSAADCLRAGLTLKDNVRAYLREVTFTPPDDWAPLSPLNGFVSSVGSAPLAVRKAEDGEVFLRAAVTRAAGAPAVDTIIATMPATYAPPSSMRRQAESSVLNTLGGWRVDPQGNLRWLFGDPSAPFYFGTASWTAADRRPVPWAEPLVVELQVPWRPAYVQVLTARYGAERLRQLTGAGAVLWQDSQVRAGVRRLEISRILGLAAGQEYRLLLAAFPE